MRKYPHLALALMAAIWGLPQSTMATEYMASSQQSLQLLIDKQDLYELNARYARAVDRKNFDDLARLYSTDSVHDHGGMFKGTPNEFISWLKGSMVEIETQHFIGNTLFHIDGDRATGEIYTVNFHHLKPQSANYIAGGRYLDEYVKVNGKWQFKSRLRVLDWSEERPSNAGQTAASLVRGGPHDSDPSRHLRGF